MKKILTLSIASLLVAAMYAAPKQMTVTSPDSDLCLTVTVGEEILYSLSHQNEVMIEESPVSMTLADGTSYGAGAGRFKAVRRSADERIQAAVYKKSVVNDVYNELSLDFKTFSLLFRVYDDGMAYRFVSRSKTPFNVASEQVVFNFPEDFTAYVPYVKTYDRNNFDRQFFNSFENTYSHIRLSEWDRDRLSFMPLTVEAAGGKKICITESDLLDYPGMYLHNPDGSASLKGVFAAVPDVVEQGGYINLQGVVKSRKPYIAECGAGETFPWRIAIVAENDAELLDSDMVYRLASPAEGDFSWVKPGKVAWDWWNNWNLYGVDFEAGINNETYKYYIDFASANGIEYVLLDDGWSHRGKADLMTVIPEIDLKMLSDYAASKNVGLILWAGYWALDRDMENVCRHYSEMGIKGFKVDFMDRDDQQMVDFHRRAAEMGARYHLLMDFHGSYKPSGLQRTYPNVLNFEGVYGLENMKWNADADQVEYDVTIPFIRMVAGPMDYTQGAMRNASKKNYRPVNSEPMSQGTRCRQLAEYVVFESPLNMLCDSPSNYIEEQECTDFIADVPVTWDETRALDGKIADYVAVARRKGDVWYVAAMTDWSPRSLTLDLSFLGDGEYEVLSYSDGPNAAKAARDYRVEKCSLDAGKTIVADMASGGGFVAVIRKQ